MWCSRKGQRVKEGRVQLWKEKCACDPSIGRFVKGGRSVF